MDVSVDLRKYTKGYHDEETICSAMKELFFNLGLDLKNYGKKNWNPFSDFINKGDNVVIKPNLVLHHNNNADDIDAVVTNASVLKPIIDYALLALNGTGTVTIADAPHGDAIFESIVDQNGLLDLVNNYHSRGVDIGLRDLRKFYYPDGFFESLREEKEGDVEGYTEVKLGEESYLSDLSSLDRLYGSDFNRKFIVDQHVDGTHKYMISNTILNADVIISVPKLKTHKKTGITVNLKNLVGINGNKNYLAHYRVGSPKEGGDEYPDTNNLFLKLHRFFWSFSRDNLLRKNTMLGRKVYRYACWPFMKILRILYERQSGAKLIEKGNWYGNDTCWRMCLDLNYILRYSDKSGIICNKIQRKYFCIVDGIIAGECEGPMDPTPKNVGVLVAGFNPYYADYVCANIMGFAPNKVPFLKNVHHNGKLPDISFNDIEVSCVSHHSMTDYHAVNLNFEPQYGWRGHIEISK